MKQRSIEALAQVEKRVGVLSFSAIGSANLLGTQRVAPARPATTGTGHGFPHMSQPWLLFLRLFRLS